MTLIGIVPSWVEERKITINQDYVEAFHYLIVICFGYITEV